MAAATRKKIFVLLVILLIYFVVLLLIISFQASRTKEKETAELPHITEIEEPLEYKAEEIVLVEEPKVIEYATEEPIVKPVEELKPSVEISKIEEEIFIPVMEEEAPIIVVSEEEPLEIIPVVAPTVKSEPKAVIEEYDPWADFYVAGEEDYSIFSDGSYLVPYIVNGDYLTDINITFSDDDILVEVKELSEILSSMLTDTFRETLFSTDQVYYSLDELSEFEILTYYDYASFELHMDFSSQMMPVRVLSIGRTTIARYSAYSMSGSETLKPAFFSWFANISIFSLLDMKKENDWKIPITSSLFTMQVRNSVSLANIAFDFFFIAHPAKAYNDSSPTSWSTDIKDYITFQGIQGFYDFRAKSLRLTFGNLTDYLGYSTESIGIAVEKRYNYGDVKPRGHQYEYSIDVREPSLVEVFINDKSVYRRQLQAGIYKLKDFLFSQGANYAKVEITPLADESLKEVKEFALGYDSRLLAKSDTLFSFGLSTKINSISDVSFRGNQQIGVTDTFSLSYSLGLSLAAINLSLNGSFATLVGSMDAQIGASYSEEAGLGYTGRYSYRIAAKESKIFSSFSFNIGYTSGNYSTSLTKGSYFSSDESGALDFSSSLSGSLTQKIRYSLNGNLSWYTDSPYPSWTLAANLGTSIIPKLGVSGSITLSQKNTSPLIDVRGQISVNYTLGSLLSVSANTNVVDSAQANISLRAYKSETNNLQFSFGFPNLFDDPLKVQGSASFSHISPYYGLSIRQQYNNQFEDIITSVSLNTSIAYAGGLVGMARSISDSFLLVRPTGVLKGSKIAVTRTMSSEPVALPILFGTSTYSTISTHQNNNVVVYGMGDSLFGSAGSYIYEFNPRPRQAYAVKIRTELSYSVVGTLLRNENSPYSRYAVDLYRVEVDEYGDENLIADESLYLFTDETGFFFISGITAGTYQFSLFLPESDEDDLPIDIRFIIKADSKEKDSTIVYILKPFVASKISEALEHQYYDSIMGIESDIQIFDDEGYYWLDIETHFDEDTFWEEYYPNREIFSPSVDLTAKDELESIIQPTVKKTSGALERLSKENMGKLLNMRRLQVMLKLYLDAVKPQLP